MQIAYDEIRAALSAALAKRGYTDAAPQLMPIEPPRAWGVASNVCFTLAGKAAAADVARETAGMSKAEAKKRAGELTRAAGEQLAKEIVEELMRVGQASGLPLTRSTGETPAPPETAAGTAVSPTGEMHFIREISAEGAYINFYYDADALAQHVVAAVEAAEALQPGSFGKGAAVLHNGRPKRIMVEYAQPNTHKDFHVGHLRNASIGQAIANLLEHAGNEVLISTYIGDVGMHVAKAMLGSKISVLALYLWFNNIKLITLSTLQHFGIQIETSVSLNHQIVDSIVEEDPRISDLNAINICLSSLPDNILIDFGKEGFGQALPDLELSPDYIKQVQQEIPGRHFITTDEMSSFIEQCSCGWLAYWGGMYKYCNLLHKSIIEFDNYLNDTIELLHTKTQNSDVVLKQIIRLSKIISPVRHKFDNILRGWLKSWEKPEAASRVEWLLSREHCLNEIVEIFEELHLRLMRDSATWFTESVVDDSEIGLNAAENLRKLNIATIDEEGDYKGALYVDFAAQADAVRVADPAVGGTVGPTGDEDGGQGRPPHPVFREDERKRIRQLGKMTILRSDGTSLYQTKELGLAKYKFDNFAIDESLYVVGAEQKLYFEQVFAILRLWGFPNAENCKHISYELVVLPSGKMSSREGNIVSYRELRDEAVARALKITQDKGSAGDAAQTARDIAIAAIKYTMLQVTGSQQITFDFEQALSFEGRAAPYLQYAYARTRTLVEGMDAGERASLPVAEESRPETALPVAEESRPETAVPVAEESRPETAVLPEERHPAEIGLARCIARFPDVVQEAAAKYEPATLCTYLYDLAGLFAEFYRDCRVLDAPPAQRSFRQRLVRAFRNLMRTGFTLLALPLPEQM